MTRRTPRRKNDAYMTPQFAVAELLNRFPIFAGATVLEPCSGDGAIAIELLGRDFDVVTNDIDPLRPADLHEDVATPEFWVGVDKDWIISNPPFNKASIIIPLAYKRARVGIAMLLRYSYLEPCDDRGPWLAEHPPTALISVPRISFTGNGKTDLVATAWMIWLKPGYTLNRPAIQVVPKCA